MFHRNNLRGQAGTWCWLTPPGVSALALLFLRGRPSPPFGRSLKTLNATPRLVRLTHEQGALIDEAMGCRERGGILLTVHGGLAVRRAIENELSDAGWRQTEADTGFGRTPFERRTLDLLPQARGAAAVSMTLQAAGQGRALAAALKGGKAPPPELESARFLYSPPRVQLWGPVNAGKSSLLNALCGRSLAAVGEEPGLTRDVIEGRFEHQEFEVRLFDAPGVWAGGGLDDEALALARHWRSQSDLTLELVPPGATPPGVGWWYHSRADESGLEGLSVRRQESLEGLKDRIVEHFFGPLRRLPPEQRFALHPELRAEMHAGNAAATKWLGE